METTQVSLGLILGIIAGGFLGSFALPMKRMIRWNWEQIWLIYSVWALIILPWTLAFSTVPDLTTVFVSVPISTIFTVFIFGAFWGIGSIGFGIGIKMLGLALGTAIVLGMNNVIGSILPIILYHPEKLLQPVGLAVTGGVCIMIVGIVVCAIAGAVKDKAKRILAIKSEQKHAGAFVKGLTICFVAGICGAMFNFALIAGQSMEKEAVRLGATPINAVNSTWCIALFGGFAVTMLYCLYMTVKNNSWHCYVNSGASYWVFSFLMGFMWFGGVALYGMAVTRLGALGPSIGWPIIQSMAVASGNFWGIVTGEWKDTGQNPLRIMITGLILLFIGIGIIGWSSTLS